MRISENRYIYKAFIACLEAQFSPFFFRCIPVEKSRWILTLRRAFEGRGEDGRPRTSQMFSGKIARRDCRCRKQGDKKAPPGMKGKDERGRKGKKRSRISHEHMHGAHQFSVKPINFPRVLPENEAFDRWRTHRHCSQHRRYRSEIIIYMYISRVRRD